MSSIHTGSPLASTRPGQPDAGSELESGAELLEALEPPVRRLPGGGAPQRAVVARPPPTAPRRPTRAPARRPAGSVSPALSSRPVSASARATALSRRELTSARSRIVATCVASRPASPTQADLQQVLERPEEVVDRAGHQGEHDDQQPTTAAVWRAARADRRDERRHREQPDQVGLRRPSPRRARTGRAARPPRAPARRPPSAAGSSGRASLSTEVKLPAGAAVFPALVAWRCARAAPRARSGMRLRWRGSGVPVARRSVVRAGTRRARLPGGSAASPRGRRTRSPRRSCRPPRARPRRRACPARGRRGRGPCTRPITTTWLPTSR